MHFVHLEECSSKFGGLWCVTKIIRILHYWKCVLREPLCDDTIVGMMVFFFSCCVRMFLGRVKICLYLGEMQPCVCLFLGGVDIFHTWEECAFISLRGMSAKHLWSLMCYNDFKIPKLSIRCIGEPWCNHNKWVMVLFRVLCVYILGRSYNIFILRIVCIISANIMHPGFIAHDVLPWI